MTLALPPGDFHAYLFDCDGTVADSMPLHLVAWQTALAEFDCTFTAEQFYGWGGLPAEVVIENLNAEQGLHMYSAIVADRKEELYYQLLPQLKAVPEVLEHVLAAQGRVRTAIVSGSTLESVTASLETLGLMDKFDTLVCAGRLRVRQAQSGAVPDGGPAAGRGARTLSGVRGCGARNRRGESCRHGIRQGVAELGEGMIACPCCGFRTIQGKGELEMCPVCLWQDDGIPVTDPKTYMDGPANLVPLFAARYGSGYRAYSYWAMITHDPAKAHTAAMPYAGQQVEKDQAKTPTAQ